MLFENQCISYERLCEKLVRNPQTMLEYLTVRSVVVAFLTKFQRIEKSIDLKEVPLFHGKRIISAREFRSTLTAAKTITPCAIGFWKRKLNYTITKNDWKVCFETISETRPKVLQWKILHNLYPTNIMLSRMKVRDNNHCSYCSGVIDFIEHFFFTCPVISIFWKNVEQFILTEFNLRIKLSVTDILFGINNLSNIFDPRDQRRINSVLLIAKVSISIFKKTNAHSDIFSLFINQWQLRTTILSSLY